MSDLVAILLCGGESRRMGRSKAALILDGETFLLRSVRQTSSLASTVIVAAAPGQPLPGLPPSVLIARDRTAGSGPLEGLASAVPLLPACASLVLVVPIDAPHATGDWLRALAGRIEDFEAIVPVVEGWPNPLQACYRATPLRAAIEVVRARGERRARNLLDHLRWRPIEGPELRSLPEGLEALRNVNTPEDYRRVERRQERDR